MEFTTVVRCGKTKRKTEQLFLSLSDIKGDANNWSYRVKCCGVINENKVLEGNSAFDCVVLGLAFLRQTLRRFLELNPKVKFYEEIEEQLQQIEIDDIFWTHDCIVDDDD